MECNNGHNVHLDLEIPGELLQRDLSVTTHDNVGSRLVNGLPRLLAFLLPYSLHGKATKLYSLRRTGSSGSNGLMRRWSVPKIGEDGNACQRSELAIDTQQEEISSCTAGMNILSHGVLVLVDQVF